MKIDHEGDETIIVHNTTHATHDHLGSPKRPVGASWPIGEALAGMGKSTQGTKGGLDRGGVQSFSMKIQWLLPWGRKAPLGNRSIGWVCMRIVCGKPHEDANTHEVRFEQLLSANHEQNDEAPWRSSIGVIRQFSGLRPLSSIPSSPPTTSWPGLVWKRNS